MYDKILAVFSFALLSVFLAILGIWVESTSLRIVLIITVLMCGYDFWIDAFATRKNGNGKPGH